MADDRLPNHPYIPNAEAEVRAKMLSAIGAASIEELYADVPSELRLHRRLDLPEPLRSEAELVRHVEGILARNRTTRQYLSFLGGGCAGHYVPAVCDEVNGRGELLTSYSGHAYEEHGRWQALFEYQSMMGSLLEMDVVNVPTYDGFQAAATALRMSARITGRPGVLVSGRVSPDLRAKLLDYLKPDVRATFIPHDESGLLDLARFGEALDDSVAGVYLENPGYLGLVESRGEAIAQAAHDAGAIVVVGVDPISLGVLRPPAAYGADIVSGDVQSLGIHLQYGGGLGGFIATQDDLRFVQEYPSRLYGLAPTSMAGEYGFGDVLFKSRTSFGRREEGKEWTGTAAALWGITAGVYLALMGPDGMYEVGEGIMARSRYAMERLAAIPGVRIPYLSSPHFKEFVVDVSATGRTVSSVNEALLSAGIFGGHDLSREFPDLGQAALYCVTELHTVDDIDRLVGELTAVLR